jgi:hypothetical protein
MDNWRKWQSIDRPKPSRIISPNEASASSRRSVDDESLLIERNRKEDISPPDGAVLKMSELFEKTYANYPRKEGKAKGLAAYRLYLTKGKDVSGVRYRFNHQQLYIAIDQYAIDCAGKDKQFIKHFDTFMNGAVVDYVEKTKQEYEAFMRDTYGDQWEKERFGYA